MSTNTGNSSSGEGTRPVTDGGVDNIGGASSFTPGKPSSPADSAPKPHEKMAEKKADSASMKEDDSAAFGLRETPDHSKNTEPPARERPVGSADQRSVD